MARHLHLVIALVLVWCSEKSAAWGPIFEPLKGGGWNIGTALRALESSSGHEEESLQDRREKLHPIKPTFTFHFQTFEQMGVDPVLQPIIYSKPLSFEYVAAEDECVGDDDCDEECEIPEEYKTAEGASFDVMAYLGISRAEPLRVKEGYGSVYE